MGRREGRNGSRKGIELGPEGLQVHLLMGSGWVPVGKSAHRSAVE